MNATYHDALFRLLEDSDITGAFQQIEASCSSKEDVIGCFEALWDYSLSSGLTVHFGLYVDELNLILLEDDADYTRLSYLLKSLAEAIMEQKTEWAKNQKKLQAETVIFNLKRYIRNNLDQDLSLQKLSELTHYNPSYLSRLFRQSNGYTIAQYIEFMRLEKAKEELQGTGFSISEVAKHVGINSPRYFSSFFKENTRFTPREYRYRYQSDQD